MTYAHGHGSGKTYGALAAALRRLVLLSLQLTELREMRVDVGLHAFKELPEREFVVAEHIPLDVQTDRFALCVWKRVPFGDERLIVDLSDEFEQFHGYLRDLDCVRTDDQHEAVDDSDEEIRTRLMETREVVRFILFFGVDLIAQEFEMVIDVVGN